MKLLILISVLLSAFAANAGSFVEKSAYVPHSVIVGTGVSLERARADALAALPEAYKLDAENSPMAQCLGGGAPDMQIESCGSSLWQMTMPLVRIEH